ncbi:DNA topoisomerase (ATP-hydrolyzing) subunit B [Prevotella sp. P2-180]|uniref:DNA topoisomerase (ATP-hydrolyzing) subunit B n=1 Tax=Prevotella sp. P2-180 TaxID=2024224 RepID=UPI000B976AFE|nr:DNA topoisomerase (ATP-hydrolyzing) subunit B [Prevotella sp. P2-180]MCI6338669.1 DNA topoisomerase (ATP-hydrolyzing) subunit B [Prevotella sp.]MCI7088213.1 DNA topoisomerase (ATP-hydrolyzing) subunit B [Prevotella sp.]MDD5784258.1 DNA topoisomerase (ATP-hydrolyzing) subunit B [Prevotella sp.]MDD6862799.1 DNA topoisomerase (ATP-hydrolyzing) subunit B [Prevotella sp.]MDD7224749.1 DNA topoisomerase (ATP-hydrolyzing) subunit B [Prevotella sp.]
MAEDIIKESNYSASNIQVLEGLEAVRKRPAMYIGDISEKGLHHLVNETVDNSIDEAMAGYCTHIEVTINQDESITVQDNGRGIPVDEHEKLHKSALEVVMTVLHAGGKFDKGSYKVSGGLHGVGVSCVNALSSRMMSQVFRDGKIYQQEYEKGKPLYPVKIVGETELRGTRQQFWPDPTVFTTTTYKYDIIAKRMRELAYLNAGITITLTDLRPDEEGNTRQEVFHAKDGLKEFVRYVDRHRTHLFDDVIYLKTEKQGVPIEVAVMYNTDYSENIHSYVNNINTIEGGTHLVGFRMALTRTLKKYADADPVISKQIEKAKIEIAGEDFREGLTAVISIKVAEPQFEGQTKTKLGNSEVTGAVQQAVGEALTYYLEEHPKEAKQICDKVILAATARIAARKARESVQRKNPMTGGGLPGKLADCSNKDPKECEIFLVEGDSAGGSAKQGRDRYTQAILPLRGKILNVEKVMWHKVFESESVMNIIQSIGVRFGVEGEGDKEANIDKLRYDKIIIMTDADVDGSHIDTLIMTLFYRFMPKVIQEGHLYIATPPLYLCTYKNQAKEYCYTDQQRQAFLDKWGNGVEDGKTIHTQRYKGLGEMNPEQLWETTMNPQTRLLKQVTIENAAEADEIFSMLMGDDVEPRREFIEKNATYANIDA